VSFLLPANIGSSNRAKTKSNEDTGWEKLSTNYFPSSKITTNYRINKIVLLCYQQGVGRYDIMYYYLK
jgi:hypothetical protein